MRYDFFTPLNPDLQYPCFRNGHFRRTTRLGGPKVFTSLDESMIIALLYGLDTKLSEP
jgi:hypothetical protein